MVSVLNIIFQLSNLIFFNIIYFFVNIWLSFWCLVFISGFPQPSILWSKNGQELTSIDNVKTSYAHNHVKLELKNVNIKDAGRYTCTVSNDVGSASSTADLVVKSKCHAHKLILKNYTVPN